MRHRRKTTKLQRNSSQRRALLSNQACSLIEHGSIRTTLAKAKALRPIAEKMVTLGKKAHVAEKTEQAVHYRRQAARFLRQKVTVQTLFNEIAPAHADRKGGYTRITRLGQRQSDSAPMALIEWMDFKPAAQEAAVGE